MRKLLEREDKVSITVAFLSNYLNHHQIPFSDAMNKREDTQYYFIQSERMEAERIGMGWKFDEEKYPYLVKYYEEPEIAQNIIDTCDVLITGIASSTFLRKRNIDQKLTFLYTERVYKRGQWRVISPRGAYFMNKTHLHAEQKNMYLLCASAYTPCDMAIWGFYKNRMFKWGYFPEVNHLSLEETMEHKKDEKVKIVWCGRFIKLKHPEMIFRLAQTLKKRGYETRVEITMIGVGELRQDYENKIIQHGLEDMLHIEGPYTPQEVRDKMVASQIFIATSDYQEGWGAVINEAMTSGCAVVASHAMGSVPYLIQHKENGLIFKSGDNGMLQKYVMCLIEHSEVCRKYGENAYCSIRDVWSAENAANNFVKVACAIFNGNRDDEAVKGPCSRAKVIKERKMYEYCVSDISRT